MDFKISYTSTLGKKFKIVCSLQIPPHLKGVATLPYEILIFKNCTYREHSNGRLRGGIFGDQFIANFLLSVFGKRILTVGQYLAKVWTRG